MQGPLSLKNKMLSTPLLNISKASTPVRTRIISSNSALNSTPINQLKFTTTVSRSPASKYHNKQKQNNMNNNNFNVNANNEFIKNHNNQQNYSGYQKYQKQPLSLNISQFNKTELMSKVNLSPILQLNRKMNQGPLSVKQNNMHKQSFRSLTPNLSYYNKKQDSIQNINTMSQSNVSISNYQSEKVMDRYSQSKCIENNNIKNNHHQLRESKQINRLLKGSNSFTNLFGSKSNNLSQSKSNNLLQSKSKNLLENKSNNLLQSRNKTPTRLGSMAFSSLNKKNSMIQSKSSSGILRDSNKFLFSQLANKQNCNPLKLDSSSNPFAKMNQSKKSLLNNKQLQKKLQLESFNSPKQNSSFANKNSSLVNKNNLIEQSQLRLICMNHQNKKAKYKVVNEEIVYCSKCAMQVIQRGISVEQLQLDGNLSDYNSPDRLYENYSQYNNSPIIQYEKFNQSSSFKNKFQSFKPQLQQNSVLNQCSKTIQQLKNKIKNNKQIIQTKKEIIQRQVNQSILQMDNYYDSLIKYIDYQRRQDKQQLLNRKQKDLMNKNNTQQQLKYNGFINQLEYMNNLIKKNSINTNNYNSFNKQLQLLKIQIQQNTTLNHSQKINQNIKIININQSIQNQFNLFIQIFDEHLKFKYNQNIHQSVQNCYQSASNYQNKNKIFKNNVQRIQIKNINNNQQNYINENKVNNMNRLPVQQNNGLRFSFQKALQNQNNKKRVLLQSKMKPLQQQSQQQQSQQQNSLNNNNCDWNYSQNTINLSSQQNIQQKIIQNINNSDQNQYYYEQNSFHNDCIQNMINHNHNQQKIHKNSMNQKMFMYQDQIQNVNQNYDEEQKPFRTLFVEDDQILCQNQNYRQNNNILQNRCTIIDLGMQQDQSEQNQYQQKKNIQSPVFKTR